MDREMLTNDKLQASLIEALSHEYDSLWYISTGDKMVHPVSLSRKDQDSNNVRKSLKDLTYPEMVLEYADRYINDEDKAEFQREMEYSHVLEMTESKKVHHVSFAQMQMDGARRYFQGIFARSEDHKGNSIVVMGFRDVTDIVREQLDRKEALEEQSKKLADANAIIEGLSSEYHTIWVVDKETTNMRLVRSAWEDIHSQEAVNMVKQFEKWDDPAIDYARNYVEESDQDRVIRETSSAEILRQLRDKDRYEVNFLQRFENGYLAYQQMAFVNAVSPEGREQFVCGFRDIDALVKAEQAQRRELEIAREAAEAANNAKSTFLFNMSHDIRTPLNAIIGFTELAARTPDDLEKLAGYRTKVLNASHQLMDILNNVLEMARIENNKTTIETELTDARDYFESWTGMFEGEMKMKRQTMRTDCNVEHQYLYLDQPHLTEILMNIVSNAVKYTPEGGEISMAIRELSHSGDNMCLIETTISDNGIGMPAEYLEHIFDQFSRERNSSVSGIQGSGLGMAIVKRLVDMMDGIIAIDSEQGQGTEVRICIPHRFGNEADFKAKARNSNNNYDFTGKRILMAEDIDVNAILAAEILTSNGFMLDRARDGAECIEMLTRAEAGYYDLILMDIQMPNMNGYEAAGRIREMDDFVKSGIPILAMTANAFKEDQERAIQAGMNGHIAKPIDVDQLFRTLGQHLNVKEK